MSSWICDGVPKDGKDYSGLGGKHEPINNDLSDCEYCGLPKEAMISGSSSGGVTTIIGGNGNSPWVILIVIITGVLLLAGGSAAYFSGLFNGDRHLKTYEEAVASGKEALSIIETHKSAEELVQAQEYLSEAITKLNEIPQKAAIYPEVEAKISDYDALSTQITVKLNSPVFDPCAEHPMPKSCMWTLPK
jgi:hypothetical protein